jgi:signal transduction histidine kinase
MVTPLRFLGSSRDLLTHGAALTHHSQEQRKRSAQKYGSRIAEPSVVVIDPEFDDGVDDSLTRARAETDSNLRQERHLTDEVVVNRLEREVDDVLVEQRNRIDEEVERSRQVIDDRLRASAETLPVVADTLAEAAESLTEVAEHLADAANSLKDLPSSRIDHEELTVEDMAAALSNIAGSLTEAAGIDEAPAPPEPATSSAPKVVARMADVAESLSDVAARVAEERELADISMIEERAFLDRLLDKEREQSAQTVDFERRERQALLAAARYRTDERLARERHDTDDAMRHSFDLLRREQGARERAEDRILTRDELLAIVSHDLRSPLDVIVINAALLAGNPPPGELGARYVKWARSIERSAGVMDRLLADLLDVARFDGGEFRVVPQECDAVSLVKECVEAFAPLASHHGIRLDVDLPASAVSARYDHDRMVQVLSNLLRNAIQFTKPGGAIMISLTSLADGCRIAVSDTGRGIPEGQLTRIFERFHRVNVADRQGLGLGLYISKRIIDAHHGEIGVESHVGRGSTFFITLPSA